MHVVPWYDQNPCCFHISGIFPETAWRRWRSTRWCMNYVLFSRFFVMNCLAARVTLPGDANTVQKCYFLYFSRSRNCRALVLYCQAPGFWFLDVRATNFSSLRSFCKIVFPDSLTVWFRWNFDRRLITCCYSHGWWRFALDVYR